MLRPQLMLIAVAYMVYGVFRFRGLFRSLRFVRRPPESGLWGPARFINSETWTPEGLARTKQLIAWQIGFIMMVVVIGLLS